ncbi:hypothetical protein [Klebsiella pneumoniae]|uniref:hypothetical protein n=1 Tax=Klebsiella pneumoniae TaxID=573 RepID=UPI00188926B2|nr:hypothetical protein [Klebsiella pneumoniae]
MMQVADIFDLFIKLTPSGLALLVWAYGVYNQFSLKKLEAMQLQKRWPELPDGLTIQDKRSTPRDDFCGGKENQSIVKMAIFFTAIAIFWTVYL